MLRLYRTRPIGITALALVGGLVLASRGEAQEARFIRGDSDASGVVEVTDATSTLNTLYLTTGALTCSDAADSNDDGLVDVSDSIHTLLYLFGDGAPPPDPGAQECGADPTPDDLGCASFAPCSDPIPSIELDEAHRVSAVISPEGGTLTTTASDGLGYALTFPPGALASPEEIILTPVLNMDGFPFGGDTLAAVHLAPEGLEPRSPATVTIEGLPELPPRSFPLGFLIQDDRQEFSRLSPDMQGDNVSLEVPHFSVAGVLEADLVTLAEFTLERYYGVDGFLDQLVRADSCGDFYFEQAARIALEFVQVVNDDNVSESSPGIDSLLGFRAFDCIYPRNTGPWKCTSFSDFAWAASLSLQNRIGEMFIEYDDLCLGTPRWEDELFSCISQAQILSQLGVLEFESYAQALIQKKKCGLVELSIDPSDYYLSVGETLELRAIPIDGTGRELTSRQVIWRAPASGVVTLVANGQRALVTAQKNGVAYIDVEDKEARDLSFAAEDVSRATAEISVGGAVEISPAELTLILPEIERLSAFLIRADGADITPLSGWSWSNTDPSVAGITSTSDNRASLRPRAPGVTVITARESVTGMSGSATVKVAAALSVTPPELCLRVFEAAQLSATLLDLEGKPLGEPEPFEIVWSSPDSSTVSVNIEGVALAQSPGRVQIEASYKNGVDTRGSSHVFVPRLPDDYRVTPVFAPSSFVWDGVSYAGARMLTHDREVVNIYEAALKAVKRCGIVGGEEGDGQEGGEVQVPRPAAMSTNGLFTYTYEGEHHTFYVFDANSCEEHEIEFPLSAWPTPIVINDHGDVAGHYTGGDGETAGFTYNAESGEFERVTAGCGTRLVDMNNHREVLGTAETCFTQGGERRVGFNFIYSNGQYTGLPWIPGVDVEDDPTTGLTWILPSSINDEGVVVGSYRYFDEESGWWREKGFIFYEGKYALLDPPFQLTMPLQWNWGFKDINNHDDVLILSSPLAREERLEGILSIMHLCPLE